MLKRGLLLSGIALMLGGCSGSNDFMPTPEMSGEEIFNAACKECHSPKSGYVMLLSQDMNSTALITNQVLSGSMTMPSFPNLQGEPAQKLAEYVLANSKVME